MLLYHDGICISRINSHRINVITFYNWGSTDRSDFQWYFRAHLMICVIGFSSENRSHLISWTMKLKCQSIIRLATDWNAILVTFSSKYPEIIEASCDRTFYILFKVIILLNAWVYQFLRSLMIFTTHVTFRKS